MSTLDVRGGRSGPHRLLRNWIQDTTITISDLKFIGVLWSSEFINPWVQIWAEESPTEVSRPADSDSRSFSIYYAVLMILKLLTTIAVSVFVDLRNHKFTVYLISLSVYWFGPIFGVVATFVQNVVLRFLLLSLTASLFVTYPTKFCLIFNQRPTASITETRVLVALFEMITSLSLLLLFIFFFFSNNKFALLLIIVVWVILILLIAGVIVLTVHVRRYATKEVVKEPNFIAIIDGIRHDVVKKSGDSSEAVKRKTVSAQRFVLFVLLLLPILVITSIDVTLTAIDSVASRNIQDDSPKKVYKLLAKLVAIPAIALFFSGARGVVGRLGDILVIATAHAFNTIVIMLIVVYFNSDDITIDTRQIIEVRSLTNVTVISGHIPNSEQAVVRIFGGTSLAFNLETPFFNTSKPETWVEFVVDVKHHPSFEMEIRKDGSNKMLPYSMKVNPKERYWFLLLGADNDFTEIVRVYGVEEPWIFESPKLLVVNGIVRDANPKNFPKFIVLEEGSNVSDSYSLTPSNMAASMILKEAVYRFRYDTAITNPVLFKAFTEYVAIIYNFNGLQLTLHKTLSVSPVSISTNKLLHASYVLSGLTQAATNVGYIHFFWMESPMRLRTALLACFIVTNEIVAEITRMLIHNFGMTEALIYLGMRGFAGLYHICLGLLYDFRFRRSLDTTPDDSPSGQNEPKIPEEPLSQPTGEMDPEGSPPQDDVSKSGYSSKGSTPSKNTEAKCCCM